MAVTVDKIRVAIVDDHQSIIDGHKYRLSQDDGIEVVATARYGNEIEELLEQYPINVLVLDINLPMASDNINPFHVHYAISKYTQKYPGLKVLVVSMYETRRLIESVMKSGASGYVLKDDDKAIKELGSIVRLISNGGKYFSPKAGDIISGRDWPEVQLSPRQFQALSLCAAYPGATFKELAKMMNIAPSTVRNLLWEVYKRLEVPNRAAAISKARSLGLIP